MSDTAVAEARAPQPAEGDRKEGRWRSHWAARIGLPAFYLLATAVAIDRIGLPYSQDWIFVWIVGLMLAFSIADGQHTVRRLIKDWLPIIVALFAYDLLRGVADGRKVRPAEGHRHRHEPGPGHVPAAEHDGQSHGLEGADDLYRP